MRACYVCRQRFTRVMAKHASSRSLRHAKRFSSNKLNASKYEDDWRACRSLPSSIVSSQNTEAALSGHDDERAFLSSELSMQAERPDYCQFVRSRYVEVLRTTHERRCERVAKRRALVRTGHVYTFVVVSPRTNAGVQSGSNRQSKSGFSGFSCAATSCMSVERLLVRTFPHGLRVFAVSPVFIGETPTDDDAGG